MGRKKDRFWEYAEEFKDSSNNLKCFKCKFCHGEFRGSISRIKPHLAKVTGQGISVCPNVSDEVQTEASIAIGGPNKKAKEEPSTSNFEKIQTTSTSSSSPSTTLHHSTALELSNNKDKSAVDKLLAQHVVLNNIPINVVQTTSFSHFVQGVAEYGPGYRLPSDSTLKTKLIPDLRMEVDDYVGNVKKSWVKTGCTLMLDLWSDKKQGDFISIIASSPKGAVFMKAFEIPNERKEELNLEKFVSSVIEEIGPDHVVQFITNARKFDSVGDELVLKYPRMYKTRCVAHGIHILSKDIYEKVGWVKKLIDDANLIVTYMHKNDIISSLMREHTNNKVLKRPCMTRFASNFLMLQSIFDVENELRSLVASSKWRKFDFNNEDKAKRVTSIIESTKFWSQCQEGLQVLKPFMQVLQLAESDGSTSGYLYEAMERAKEAIKQQCGNNQAKYMRILELFEESHTQHIIHPIHAAATFLNPASLCSDNFREDCKMIEGISFILENLVAIEEQDKFIEEVQIYRIKESSLFTNTAKRMLKMSHPRTWWDFNGHTLPTLKKYAVRILSQPCSSSSCIRNCSAFEAAQTKKRNKLAPELLDNLVYVRMNKMMMEKFKLLEAQGTKLIDLDKLSELPVYADHEQDCEGDALDAIDEGFDDDVIIKDSNPSRLDGKKPIDLDKLSELPKYADHEEDCESDALDAIDEGFDDDVIIEDSNPSRLDGKKPIDLDKLSELPKYADHEEDCESDALDAIDEGFDDDVIIEDSNPSRLDGKKPIDLDKLSELPKYVDHEEDCESDALDAIDEGFDDDVIIEDSNPLRSDENSVYQMENVGESIVPDLQKLFNKLKSPELLEFAQQEQVDTELKKWEKFLSKIDAVHDDAEHKTRFFLVQNCFSVENWLSKLADLVYDVEDILEEIDSEASRRNLMVERNASTNHTQTFIPASSSGLNPSANFNVEMRSKIDEITSRLQEIVTQTDDLNLREHAGRRTNKLRGRAATTSLVDESHVYGREKDKEAILELLLKDERSDGGVCVISIIGMAGVGKTTLAQLVYNDGKVNGGFDMKAWVYVSKENNIHRITETILRAFTLQTDVCEDWNDLNSLQVSLRSQLQGMKFLLVLDDVWKESCDQWYVLHGSFMAGALGSKIVVTTRDESVASTMGRFASYHLKELSFDGCLPLFAHHALGTELFDGHSNLKVIGEEIVRRCKGLPLTVKTLGSLLRSTQNCDDWKAILNNIICSLSEEENEILPILSYHYLPSHLKRCFTYCAIFPKGYEFDKDELVLLWMAEGFLQELKGKKHMEDLGLEYFQELLSRSLFQQSSRNKSRFVMHDVINDIAKSVAGEICFNLEDDTVDKSLDKVRHLAFNTSPYDALQRFKVFYQMKGLRTFLASPVLVSGRSFLSIKVLHNLLPKLRYLRSLSLRGYEIRELPDSIGDLKLLRYLNLSFSSIHRLPESVSALLNLQTLLLRGCKTLYILPAGIGNLTNMHHLDIIDTFQLHKMPSGIGNLTSLQTLPKFIVGKGDGLRARDLENLSNLRGQLSIFGLCNVVETRDAMVANMKEKQGLDELVLNWSDDDKVSKPNAVISYLKEKQGLDELVSKCSDDEVSEKCSDDEVSEQSDNDKVSEHRDDDEIQVLDLLQPDKNLKKLTITSYGGTKFPSWIGDSTFSNLEQLNLLYCLKSTLLPSLGRLPSLKNLSIKGMNAVKTVGVEFYGVNSPSVKAFPSLESLSFKDMLGWEQWFSCTSDEEDVFPCLRNLVIQNCPNLVGEIPNHFVSLDNLYISRCPRLENSIVRLPSPRELKIEECFVVVLLSLVDLTSVKTLKIVKISGLACLDNLVLEGLEVLEIEDCNELMYLWEDGANLENLACLKKLIVKNCPQLVSLARDEGGLLPCSLEELELEHCHKFGKLPNGLHSLTCLRSLSIKSCYTLISFPAIGLPYTLRRLQLWSCKALESLPDGMMIHGGNSNQCLLEELVIYYCPSLKSFPRGMLPTTLKKMKISGCENLESLPEGMILDDNDSNNTSHLKSLEISHCTQLKSLSKRILHHNTSLEVIRLWKCTNLRSLPLECLHRLAHLSELYISDSPSLESFPERGLSIPNLKSLTIGNCENIKSLPNQMHNLTTLQTLTVYECPEIVSFPKGGLPPNLTSLEIRDCENLKQSMSEWSLHRLSSLREFTLEFNRFYKCPLDIVSFLDEDCSLLPTTLTSIRIKGISNLESISKGIQNLTSLEKLGIWDCPKLHSLPKEGLPASLGYLYTWECPILKERCAKEKGEYWPIISHIPLVMMETVPRQCH